MPKINFYRENIKFYVAVDCIIFGFKEGKLSLLLLKRKFEPSKGKWSLMGGFIQEGESAEDAAKRVLKELTGLDNIYMEQVGAFSKMKRDPGERVISIAYYTLINVNDYDKHLVENHNAFWADINELPELIFDHKEMVEKARNMMKQRVSNDPIGFNLLSELFTLTQLQNLYEAIYGENIDKRNFRKRVTDMVFIEKTGMIDKSGSKRGARLYKLNNELYHKNQKFKI